MKHVYIIGILLLVIIIGAIMVTSNKQSAISPDNDNITTPDQAAAATDTEQAPDPAKSKGAEINVASPAEGEVKIITPQPPTNEPPEYSGAVIKTTLGDIMVSFYGDDSPMTVNNFINLAQIKFYDGILFHRVIPDFMVQVGDPLSRNPDKRLHGTGGPGYTFADEFNDHPLVMGSLAMANSGPNTNGSQFFIVTADSTPWLDGKHTNFGIVTSGLDVVKQIQNVERDARDNPLEPVQILSVELIK